MNMSIELTAILGFSVAAVFAFAGLTFATKRNSKDIETLWKKHDNLGEEIRRGLTEVNTSLARIEGRLSHEQKI